MNKFRFVALLVLAIALFAVFSAPTNTYACAAATYRPEPRTPTTQTKLADMVLEGTIIKTEQQKDYSVTATVKVQQYLKGNGPANVVITNLGSGGSDCRSAVKTGDHLLIYTNGYPKAGLSASYYNAYDATEAVKPEIVKEITAAAGQAPIIPAQETTPAQPESTSTGLIIGVAGVAAIVIFGGIGFYFWKKRA
jgi:hypothetical protein